MNKQHCKLGCLIWPLWFTELQPKYNNKPGNPNAYDSRVDDFCSGVYRRFTSRGDFLINLRCASPFIYQNCFRRCIFSTTICISVIYIVTYIIKGSFLYFSVNLQKIICQESIITTKINIYFQFNVSIIRYFTFRR